MNAGVLTESASGPRGALWRHCVGQATVASVCWQLDVQLAGALQHKRAQSPWGQPFRTEVLGPRLNNREVGGRQNPPPPFPILSRRPSHLLYLSPTPSSPEAKDELTIPAL